jgi:isocitrate dehydrogenase
MITVQRSVREIFEQEYKDRFQTAGISYFYTLIDDVVHGSSNPKRFSVACKNYDGDVMSDMVASANGSLS